MTIEALGISHLRRRPIVGEVGFGAKCRTAPPLGGQKRSNWLGADGQKLGHAGRVERHPTRPRIGERDDRVGPAARLARRVGRLVLLAFVEIEQMGLAIRVEGEGERHV